MLMLESHLDCTRLLDEARALKYKLDDSGALMAYGPGRGLPNNEVLLRAAMEISNIRSAPAIHMMINNLPPKLTVIPHTDTLPEFKTSENEMVMRPKLERWHLPLYGSKSWWWDEVEGYRFMLPGRWYGPLPYWKKHSVGNDGDHDRVHLIVDLGRLVGEG